MVVALVQMTPTLVTPGEFSLFLIFALFYSFGSCVHDPPQR